MLIKIMEASAYAIGFVAVGLTLLDTLDSVVWLVTCAAIV